MHHIDGGFIRARIEVQLNLAVGYSKVDENIIALHQRRDARGTSLRSPQFVTRTSLGSPEFVHEMAAIKEVPARV